MSTLKFVTIAQARLAPKGTSLIVKVVSLGEMKQGTTGAGVEWKRQQVVVKDNSDVQELTVWNQEIGMLEVGKCYKLGTPYWKEYNGNLQLSLGKFCTTMECTEIDILPHNGQAPTVVPDAPKAENHPVASAGFLRITNGGITVSKSGVDFKKMITDEMVKEALLIMKDKPIESILDEIWACEILTKDYLQKKENQEANVQRVGLWMKLLQKKLK